MSILGEGLSLILSLEMISSSVPSLIPSARSVARSPTSRFCFDRYELAHCLNLSTVSFFFLQGRREKQTLVKVFFWTYTQSSPPMLALVKNCAILFGCLACWGRIFFVRERFYRFQKVPNVRTHKKMRFVFKAKPRATVDRKLMAPYVPHILLSARDNLDKKLFPGCGEKFVEKLMDGLKGNKRKLLEVLEKGDVKKLNTVVTLKPEKSLEICDLWKKHHRHVEQVFLQALPIKWKVNNLTRLYEFESRYVANQYKSLQYLVWCKESLLTTKKFLIARSERFSELPVDWQIQLSAKAVLYSSHQVCLDEDVLCTELEQIADKAQVEQALLKTDPLKLFTKHKHYYYLTSVWEHTNFVAKDLVQRIPRGDNMPPYDLDAADLYLLSQSQREAVELAMRSPVFVLTGGPGTGKTFVLGKLIKSWEAAGNHVAVCTFTARGANNLKKVALAKQATTIHSMLGARPRPDDETEGVRLHADENEELEFFMQWVQCDILIIDEATLVDLRLMRCILERLDKSTVVVLIGDKDQLPSVGPGSVFRDLLEIGNKHIGMYRLSEPRRYTSQLDQFANAILQGLPALVMLKSLKRHPSSEIVWIPTSVHEAKPNITKEIAAILHSVEDKDSVQVLVKHHARQWNHSVLKQLFTGSTVNKHEVGDRVMHLVNDSIRNVVNGEIGNVAAVGTENIVVIDPTQGCFIQRTQDFVSVRYPVHGQKDKIVKYAGTDELSQLTSAYAMSVHKAQGCEFHIVILIVSGYPKWTREMFYTACTRTRVKLYVLAAEWDLKHAVENCELHRTSHLVERIETHLATAT